jgi:hypothetical protein
LLNTQQVTDSERPGAEEKNTPANGEQDPRGITHPAVTQIPKLVEQRLPEQDQRKQCEVGHVHECAPLEGRGHAHDKLLKPGARNQGMLQSEQGDQAEIDEPSTERMKR